MIDEDFDLRSFDQAVRSRRDSLDDIRRRQADHHDLRAVREIAGALRRFSAAADGLADSILFAVEHDNRQAFGEHMGHHVFAHCAKPHESVRRHTMSPDW
ncbi:hypothetical protein PQR08_29335 [Caballeronia jiangsuensis]|uniref:Uncharacterized protein n=1 Tax=Caballeronia jiangsuensis TaxID=1458357 RepID=A0ABW9CSJ7_9BURK|nr:hypothetical protein [Caballeronia sp. GaOx3]